MREVELVEVTGTDAVDGYDERVERLAPSRWSPEVRARVRAVVVVGMAAVLVTTGVATLVSQRRDAARLRALADVPGVLAPLDGPLEVQWATEGWPVADIADVGDRLVTVLTTRLDRLDAVALDARTGDVVWRTPLPSDASQHAPAACVVPGSPRPGTDGDADPDSAPVLACVVADEVATTTDGPGLDQYTYAVRARLLVLDALTGELLEDDPVTPPVSLSAIGADALLGTVDDRGHAHVSRMDLRTGAVRWTFTTPEPVPVLTQGLASQDVQVRVRIGG